MKTTIIFYLLPLFCFGCVTFLQAQETVPLAVTVTLEVYPKEIYYGDLFFNWGNVQNDSDKNIGVMLNARESYYGMPVVLKQNDAKVYYWPTYLGMNSREYFYTTRFPPNLPGYSLDPFRKAAAHSNVKILLRPLWFPIHEFSNEKEARDIAEAVLSEKQQYDVVFRDYLAIPKPLVDSVTVKPRPPEDFDLLQEWFLELPNTKFEEWTEHAVFAHPYHVRNSPFQNKEHFTNKIKDYSSAFDAEVREFFQPLQTRTPESLSRIERTNELAAKIIERSKEPDSTFSQNMVEFIQLRGFLVDMRYAENAEAEEAAFEKLMDFVDESQDRELWVDFIYDIGLDSIDHHTYFPYAKVFAYRERFAERMQIKDLCRSVDDFHRLIRESSQKQ